MRILVTGGNGFIGKHIVTLLRERGHSVRVFDTKPPAILSGLTSGIFVPGSVMNVTALTNAMTDVEAVYHLAGVVGVKRILRVPVKTFVVNAIGTLNVAQLAKKVGAKMFLASSSEVYGYGGEMHLHEDETLVCDTQKRWIYTVSKLSAEMLAQSIVPADKLVIGRYFNVVGPGQHPSSGMVLPRFIDQAIRNKNLCIYGTGEQTRCFGYVTEIARATIELMDSHHHGTYNIAGNQVLTIKELAQRVKDILASESQIAHCLGPIDSQYRVADTSRLRATLGWVPDMPIEKIIQLTAGWWLKCMESRS